MLLDTRLNYRCYSRIMPGYVLLKSKGTCRFYLKRFRFLVYIDIVKAVFMYLSETDEGNFNNSVAEKQVFFCTYVKSVVTYFYRRL